MTDGRKAAGNVVDQTVHLPVKHEERVRTFNRWSKLLILRPQNQIPKSHRTVVAPGMRRGRSVHAAVLIEERTFRPFSSARSAEMVPIGRSGCAGVHRFRLADQLDLQQAVVARGALHLHMVSQAELSRLNCRVEMPRHRNARPACSGLSPSSSERSARP
jgi:hypothetical protein